MRTLSDGSLHAWAVATIGCALVVAVGVVRSATSGKGLALRIGQCVALVAPGTAFVVVWIVARSGMHPTVQMSAPGAEWAWSLWVRAWLPLLLGLPASGVLAFVLACRLDSAPTLPAGAAHVVVWTWILALHAVAWIIVAGNFPSA